MIESTRNATDTHSAQEAEHFVPLRSVLGLGELVERSEIEPVVVFQHDPHYPISRRAYNEMMHVPVPAALVDVAQDDELSRRIEERTGVRHASPQVLVLRSGKAVWDASHLKITREAVTRAIQRASADSVHERQSHCGFVCGSRSASNHESTSVLAWLRALWNHQ